MYIDCSGRRLRDLSIQHDAGAVAADQRELGIHRPSPAIQVSFGDGTNGSVKLPKPITILCVQRGITPAQHRSARSKQEPSDIHAVGMACRMYPAVMSIVTSEVERRRSAVKMQESEKVARRPWPQTCNRRQHRRQNVISNLQSCGCLMIVSLQRSKRDVPRCCADSWSEHRGPAARPPPPVMMRTTR